MGSGGGAVWATCGGATVRLLTTVFTPVIDPASFPASAREASSLAIPLRVTIPLLTATWMFWPLRALSPLILA